jgi:acetoin:2,6-dichlorophenolindophenol oxidoreductase subunit alpha
MRQKFSNTANDPNPTGSGGHRLTPHQRSTRFSANRPKVYDRLSEDDIIGALRRMRRIRSFEEAAEDSYIRGLSYGTMHLSIGQEASAVGACMPLTDADCITSTHRGHGHCIAKGAELRPMFAEFLGRESGYCRGRGGSMHIAEPARGNLGANGIVAGGLPIAVGAALSARKRRTGAVALAFFGDGANNEGAFHEALNLASIWKLPVIFVCENNQYAMSMAMARATAVANVADRASAYAIPGVIVDGNDFAAVAEASFTATDRARAGEGPTLIEAKTYRTRGHSRSDRNRYRSREEIDAWKARDPIARFEKEIIVLGLATEARVAAIAAEVAKEMAQAVAEASASPWPAAADVMRDVYSPAEDVLR